MSGKDQIENKIARRAEERAKEIVQTSFKPRPWYMPRWFWLWPWSLLVYTPKDEAHNATN